MTRRFMPPSFRSGSGSGSTKNGISGGKTITGRGGSGYGKSQTTQSESSSFSAYESKMAKHLASYRKESFGTGKQDEKNNVHSATAIAARMMAQKMATRMAGKNKGAVDLKNFKGMHLAGMYPGRIDNKGRVYGAGNQLVLRIDLKTGAIKTAGFFGRKVGKFNPKSHSSMNLIYRELEKHALKYQAMTGISATAPTEFIE